MTDTIHLGMPFIEGSQAQKHVTHNEALRILDAVIQIGVHDIDRTAPPSTPVEGDRHIVAGGATDAWAEQANAVAVYEDGAWRFLSPKLGWCAWSEADAALLVYDGSAWTDVASGGGEGGSGSLARLRINDTASDPNLLTVKSNDVLLNAIDTGDGGTGDMRLQISKEAAGATASVVFSEAFSGRAEFGLVGSNAFKLKVSDDGTTFVEALVIDQTSGSIALPRGLALTGVIAPSQITSNQNDYNPAGIVSASVLNLSSDALRSVTGLAGGSEGTVIAVVNTGGQIIKLLNESASSTAANRFAIGSDLSIAGKQAALLRYDGTASRWYALVRPGGREVLTANRTYYVRTDGNDANDGLSNASGGAFATIQRAYDIITTLDLGGFTVTIQIADGTYTAGLNQTVSPVGGNVSIVGNVATPANVIISTSSAPALGFISPVNATLSGLTLQTSGSTNNRCISAAGAGVNIFIGPSMVFGSCSGSHIFSNRNALVSLDNDYAISGSGTRHYVAGQGGIISGSGKTVTLSGTPAFSTAFADASLSGIIQAPNMTYSGSATGSRYSAASGGVINTGSGGNTSYFPGNAAGAGTNAGSSPYGLYF